MSRRRTGRGPASSLPPKGVLLDTPAAIARSAPLIRLQAVLTGAMPPNNITEMTRDERRMLANWLERK